MPKLHAFLHVAIDFVPCTTGQSGGALSSSAVLQRIENRTFLMSGAPSNPAVTKNGVIDAAQYVEFAANTLICDDGEFIDYSDPVSDASSPNASSEVRV